MWTLSLNCTKTICGLATASSSGVCSLSLSHTHIPFPPSHPFSSFPFLPSLSFSLLLHPLPFPFFFLFVRLCMCACTRACVCVYVFMCPFSTFLPLTPSFISGYLMTSSMGAIARVDQSMQNYFLQAFLLEIAKVDHTHSHTQAHTLSRSHTCTHPLTLIRTFHVHTHTYIYKHTYICIHTHTLA